MPNLPEYLHPLIATVSLVVGALIPLVDPVGSTPLYLQMIRGVPAGERGAMAKAVAFNTLMLLLACDFVGIYVLRFFGLSIPAVQAAGGMLVCALAWTVLKGPDAAEAAGRAPAVVPDEVQLRRRAFYPLTMPLTVGPGSISVAVALGAGHHPKVPLLLSAAGHAIGIVIVACAVYVCYRYADLIVRKLGETGRAVVVRLSAFLLLCIGVQLAWNGFQGLVEGGRLPPEARALGSAAAEAMRR